MLALPALVSDAGAAPLSTSNPPAFTFVTDEGLADDQPGQKDLTSQAVANPSPTDLWVAWRWDVTSLSGGNTGDGCALFDTDQDSKVNFAICVTIEGSPAVQATASPRVYLCGDGKVDRCTSTYSQVASIDSACTTNRNAADFFHSGQSDTEAICHIALSDVGGLGTANLVNTCSYPSQQPTSAPSDCVLIPRDAFLRIAKTANPSTAGTFPFRLGLTTDSAPPVVFTASGSQTSNYIAIRSDVPYNLKEDLPTNWAVSGTPACADASGTGSSNGTYTASTNTISGIDASPDNTITCSYSNFQQTGAIEITKQRSGTSVKLTGAHFTIDGVGDHVTAGTDGKVCVAGLSLGNHTVAETQAPNGHTVDPTSPKTVNVATAGTCTTGATTVTFNDPLVLGTINIHKTGTNNAALANVTFTLWTNDAPLTGGHAGTDAATAKSCTTNASGDCSITTIGLGDYWIVETVPPGYIGISDEAVSIVVGPSPGVGDVHTYSFTNSAANGTISVHKVGHGGLALTGAVFTLYTDGGLNSGVAGSVRDIGTIDVNTTKTCTTDGGGDCSFTNVPPGNYWVVETTVPNGYTKAAEKQVNLPVGTTAGQGASVSTGTITDTAVPGTVNIQKFGLNGATLNGATFTLYVDNSPKGGARGGEDTITTKTCVTAGSGTCSITGVALGDYWVVETGVPNGYSAAPSQTVTVGVGTSAPDVGDVDSLSFTDAAVDGKVSITKTDDANNTLNGAVFTLYTDVAPLGGTRGVGDTITTKTCVTAGSGTCDINGVAPGRYWVVESTTPAHYETAADQAITVGLGTAPNQGATVPVTFVDARKHRVVVIVCHEGSDTLLSRSVTVNGTSKASVSKGSLTPTQEKALCDTGGASFGDISGHTGSVVADVALGPAH